MNFLAPGAFFLGLLLPVIVAMYLLKLRRIEREVSSVYLWRRMVRDVEANAPWQKLRRNLLMILQLLFLLALILAVSRPFTWSQGGSGQAAIYILDTSASMGAADVSPSRLEAAKQRTRQMVDELPDTARVTVITAGEKAQVRLSASQDRHQAHLAIDQIQLTSGSSDLTVALELASAIAARQPDTEIVVLSDGRVDLPARLAIKGRLRYLPMGLSGDNQAISLLTLQPGTGNSLTGFAQVSNYGQNAVKRRLTLYADGQMVNAYDLDIPTGGQQAIVAEGLPAATNWIEARLDGQDILAADDQAVAVRPTAHKPRISLVSSGNVFLGTVLKLTTEDEKLTLVDPKDPAPQEADLTIYDNCLPSTDVLPDGSLLFIAPPASTAFFRTTGLAEVSSIHPLNADDPLLAHVSLGQVSVYNTVTIPLPDWATPAVAGDLKDGSGSTPLLFYGEPNGRRVAILAFDLHHSDLPLQMAFPLLWSNLINWLYPGEGSDLPADLTPGETLSFTPPSDAQLASITRPDGTSVEVKAVEGRIIFADTTQLGRYQVGWDQGQPSSFAVNLFSPRESNLKPADSLSGLETGQGQDASQQQGRREWWRPLALLALGLLTGEWMVYHRAGFARLRAVLVEFAGRLTHHPA